MFFKTTDHDSHWETWEIVKDFQDSQIMVLMVHTCISNFFFLILFDHDAHAAHRHENTEWSEKCMIMMLMNSECLLLEGLIMILMQLKSKLCFQNQLIMMLMLELYHICFKIEWSWFSCKFMNSERCAFRRTDHDSHATKGCSDWKLSKVNGCRAEFWP